MPEEQDSFMRKESIEEENDRVCVGSVCMKMRVEWCWKGLNVLRKDRDELNDGVLSVS